MSGRDTTFTPEGVERTRHSSSIGDHVVHLEKTDESRSWAPGHAVWVCERCGLRAETTRDLEGRACAESMWPNG